MQGCKRHVPPAGAPKRPPPAGAAVCPKSEGAAAVCPKAPPPNAPGDVAAVAPNAPAPKPPGEAEATLPEPPFTPATYSCGDTPPRRSRLRTQGTSSEAVVGGRSGGDAVRETVRPSWKAEGGTDGVWRQCKCGHGDGKHANRNLWFGAGRQEMALEQQPQTFANTCTCEDTGYTRVEGNRRAPRNGRWAISHR